MQIEIVKIDQLRPSKYNPRKNLQQNDLAYQKLKKSILEFDYIDPIIWNKLTGNVVGGHQRLKVLKEMGMSELAVSVVELTDTKEKILNLALNKSTGQWDDLLLAELLIEFERDDFDLDLTGFEEIEAKEIIVNYQAKKPDPKADEVPDIRTKVKPTKGDIYELGNHRIMCGDFVKGENIGRLLQDKKAEMTHTDLSSRPGTRTKSKEKYYKGIFETIKQNTNGDIYV